MTATRAYGSTLERDDILTMLGERGERLLVGSRPQAGELDAVLSALEKTIKELTHAGMHVTDITAHQRQPFRSGRGTTPHILLGVYGELDALPAGWENAQAWYANAAPYEQRTKVYAASIFYTGDPPACVPQDMGAKTPYTVGIVPKTSAPTISHAA